MKKKIKNSILKSTILTLTVALVASCYNDSKEHLYQNFSTTGCDTTSGINYSENIAPILSANCALSGCHVGSSPQSGLDLSNYNDVRQVARSGQLVGRITGTMGSIMPPTGALPPDLINQIETWVDAGACDN